MSAIAGAIWLFIGTSMEADPNNAVAAFTEYAADHLWIARHLTQLVGVIFIVVALLFLAQELECAGGKGWSRIATGGAIASLGVGPFCKQWTESP